MPMLPSTADDAPPAPYEYSRESLAYAKGGREISLAAFR
ncbi:hypothetical protein D9613_012908 [Agrocybe pediades]|uniref:Uncharacterized protein n=1 Tax=Agrocybe pediades TaxID=84607 RepID=A0A8H4QRJ6_9AGAR|nr:hypothetical protein D9613_012908 [Agrocybe pediades]